MLEIDARWCRTSRDVISVVALSCALRLPDWSEDAVPSVGATLKELGDVQIRLRDQTIAPEAFAEWVVVDHADAPMIEPSYQFATLTGVFELELAEAVVLTTDAWVPDLIQAGLEAGALRREPGDRPRFSVAAPAAAASHDAERRLDDWLAQRATEAAIQRDLEFFRMWGARALDLLPLEVSASIAGWFFSTWEPLADGPLWSRRTEVPEDSFEALQDAWETEIARLDRHEHRGPTPFEIARFAIGAVLTGQPEWILSELLDALDAVERDSSERGAVVIALALCDLVQLHWNDAIAAVADLSPDAELGEVRGADLHALAACDDSEWGKTGRLFRAALGESVAEAREALAGSADLGAVHRCLRESAAAAVLTAAPDLQEATDASLLERNDDGTYLLDGQKFDLSTRGNARRILDALAERHPAGLALEEVFQAGWPGETIDETAAKNRVYAAIRTLRKDGGLADVLVSSGGTYSLANVVIVDR